MQLLHTSFSFLFKNWSVNYKEKEERKHKNCQSKNKYLLVHNLLTIYLCSWLCSSILPNYQLVIIISCQSTSKNGPTVVGEGFRGKHCLSISFHKIVIVGTHWHTHTHTHTHTLSLSLSHSLTHSFTHSLTHFVSVTLTVSENWIRMIR